MPVSVRHTAFLAVIILAFVSSCRAQETASSTAPSATPTIAAQPEMVTKTPLPTTTPTATHSLTPSDTPAPRPTRTPTLTSIPPTATATPTLTLTPNPPTSTPTPTPTSPPPTATQAPTTTPSPSPTTPTPSSYRFLPAGPAQPDPWHPCPSCPRASAYIVGHVSDAGGHPLAGVRLVCYNEWHRYPVVASKGGGEYDFPIIQADTIWYVVVLNQADEPISPIVPVPFSIQESCRYILDWQRVD